MSAPGTEGEVVRIVRKLTDPQRTLLREIGGRARISVHAEYAPAKKLVALGLATLTLQRFGQATMDLTDLGRTALAQSPEVRS